MNLKTGDIATWTSQAAGGWLTKTGKVVACIPPEKTICEVVPDMAMVEPGRLSALGSGLGGSRRARYLVEVERKTKGGVIRPSIFYAPTASNVDKQMAAAK